MLERDPWSSPAGLGLAGPEKLGGSGGGATELCVLAEEMGRLGSARLLPAAVLPTGSSAREIADHLGQEHVSVEQDVCMSRKTKGINAGAPPEAFRPIGSAGHNVGLTFGA